MAKGETRDSILTEPQPKEIALKPLTIDADISARPGGDYHIKRHGEKVEEGSLLVPMIDARRMEVYSAVYDRALRQVRPVTAEIIGEGAFEEELAKGPVWFFGDGADKCREVIKSPNAHFVADQVPLAKNMLPLAERAFLRGEFQDTAYFEPFYLKEFVALKSKKLL